MICIWLYSKGVLSTFIFSYVELGWCMFMYIAAIFCHFVQCNVVHKGLILAVFDECIVLIPWWRWHFWIQISALGELPLMAVQMFLRLMNFWHCLTFLMAYGDKIRFSCEWWRWWSSVYCNGDGGVVCSGHVEATSTIKLHTTFRMLYENWLAVLENTGVIMFFGSMHMMLH